MAETIEKFVSRLQEEGVEVGRAAAAKIQAEAEEQAKRLIDQAREQAAQIVQSAEKNAEQYMSRAKSELSLAVRDTVKALQDTLSRAMQAVLEAGARNALADTEFLKAILKDVIVQYAEADSQGEGEIQVNVSPEAGAQLAHWAIHDLRESLNGSKATVNLHQTLKGAGFEYRVANGTVEVTVESAVGLLANLLRPELRGVLKHALNGQAGHAEGAAQ